MDHTARLASSTLLQGAAKGDTKVVQGMIFCEKDLEVTNSLGWTPLMIAVYNNHLPIVQLLLRAGADRKHGGSIENENAVHLVARSGKIKLVNFFLQNISPDLLHTRTQTGNTPFLDAVRYNNYAFVKILLQKKLVHVDDHNDLRQTALHLSITNDNVKILKLLVKNGASVNRRDDPNTLLGETPLMYAVYKNSNTIVNILIQAGASLEKQNRKGETALHIACYYGYYDCVKSLIAAGASFGFPDEGQWKTNNLSPLSIAIGQGHLNIVRYFLRQPDNERKTFVFQFAFLEAINHQQLEIANLFLSGFNKKLFLKSETWFGDQCFTLDTLALYFASQQKSASTIEFLIKAGCDPNVQAFENNNTYVNIIEKAIDSMQVDVVKRLVSTKCNLNIWIKGGSSTPLIQAILKNQQNAVCILLECEICQEVKRGEKQTKIRDCLCVKPYCDINKTNQYGSSPLLHAVINHSYSMTKLLLRHGADVNIQDNSGNTPLMFVVKKLAPSDRGKMAVVEKKLKPGVHKRVSDEILKLLLLCGADCNLKNTNGDSVVSLSINEGNLNAVVTLLNWKANSLAWVTSGKYFIPLVMYVILCKPAKNMLTMLRLLGKHSHCYSEIDLRYINNSDVGYCYFQNNPGLEEFIKNTISQPTALADACRHTIRKSLSGRMEDKVKQLPIPKMLQKFLALAEFRD